MRVSKQGLDSFGARQQAVSAAKRNVELPARANVRGAEVDVADRGDHLEVTFTAKRSALPSSADPGPPGFSQASDKARNNPNRGGKG